MTPMRASIDLRIVRLAPETCATGVLVGSEVLGRLVEGFWDVWRAGCSWLESWFSILETGGRGASDLVGSSPGGPA